MTESIMLNAFDNTQDWDNRPIYGQNVQRTPTFSDTWKATFNRDTSPIINHIKNVYKFRNKNEIGFTISPDMFEDRHLPYLGHFVNADSREEVEAMKVNLDGLIEGRKVLQNSPFIYQLGSEATSPINILGLPFGITEANLLKSVLKTGFATSLFQTGIEVAREPFDPTSQPYESAFNIGSAFIFGGALQGLIKTPSFIKNKNYKIFMDDYNNMQKALDDLTPDEIDKLPTIQTRNYPDKTIKQLTDLNKNNLDKTERYNINKEIFLRRKEYHTEKGTIWNLYKEDNFFVKFVPTPLKSFVRSPLTYTKQYMHDLGADHGMVTIGNLIGQTNSPSIYTLKELRKGAVSKALDDLTILHFEDTGGGVKFADYNFTNLGRKVKKINPLSRQNKSDITLEDWMIEVNRLRLQDDLAAMNPRQRAASDLMDKFFKDAEVELRELGLIGSAKSVGDNIKRLNRGILDTQTKLKSATDTTLIKSLTRTLERLKKEVGEQEALLQDVYTIKTDETNPWGNKPIMPKNETRYFGRYWNHEKIKANRVKFKELLVNHFTRFPKPNLPKDIDSIGKRVDETISRILEEGEYDPLDPDTLFLGLGASKHTKGRDLDIPNKDVLEFIELNPYKVMGEYTRRMAGMIEWEKKFGGRTIDDILDEIELDGIEQKMSVRKIRKAQKEYLVMYDRIVGKIIEDPARIDNKIAYVMKEAAATNFLGSAGFATITEPATMFLNHEVGTIFKGLFALLKRDPAIQQALKENKQAFAEALDIELGNASVRLTDEMRGESAYSKAWDRSKTAFYNLNGLAPITTFLKHWEGLNRQHSIIDYSIKWVDGNASKFEETWLLRNGIDKEKAIEIKNAPWQKSESGLYLANITKWKTKKGKSTKPSNFVQEDTILAFRAAMKDGMLNTVLMGTPADRPILQDGVMLLPMNIAGKLGLKEHSRYRGYARVESGLLNMPLQFYSYLMAAATKIQGAMAQGQNRNKGLTVAAFLGLGYLQYQLRVPSWVQDKDTWETKLARSFDYGLGGVYSDIFYTALHTGVELTGNNFTNGIISTKYGAEESKLDGFVGLLGAGPDISLSYGRATAEIAQGNYGEGAEQYLRILPFLRLWFLKDEMRQLGRTFGSM